MQDTTRSKLKLAFLLLIAFVPITLATFAFRAATDSGAFTSTVNKGNLISPPADITDLEMFDQRGQPLFKSFEEVVAALESDDDYQTQPWLMIYATSGECEDACREKVHLLRQMHITLNKNAPRVRRYYLHAGNGALTETTAAHFREEFPSMGIAYGSAQDIESNLAAKNLTLDLGQDDYVFFVDPVGNVMMYFTREHSIEEIKSDLERLLKYSSLG
tara:strand:- start:76887 stop:77537 length:651 start_codon:yes stop_codon:yes gene_type:complete